MTAVNKGPLCTYLVFALVFAGNLFAGFYDEVKLRAEQGDPEAQDILSYMYQSGKGVPRDLERARRWSALAQQGGVTGTRLSPQRPQSGLMGYAGHSSPRRPNLNTSSFQSVRALPRRPGSFAYPPELRASPLRRSPGSSDTWSRPNLRESELERIELGIRSYRRGKKWHHRLAQGGKLLVSPVTFTVKQSKRVVSKAFRKAAFGSVVLH